MPHNHKYGTVTVQLGDIGEDEPVFLLRARDPLSVPAICRYLALRAEDGASPGITADITQAIAEFRDWQDANSTRRADT